MIAVAPFFDADMGHFDVEQLSRSYLERLRRFVHEETAAAAAAGAEPLVADAPAGPLVGSPPPLGLGAIPRTGSALAAAASRGRRRLSGRERHPMAGRRRRPRASPRRRRADRPIAPPPRRRRRRRPWRRRRRPWLGVARVARVEVGAAHRGVREHDAEEGLVLERRQEGVEQRGRTGAAAAAAALAAVGALRARLRA